MFFYLGQCQCLFWHRKLVFLKLCFVSSGNRYQWISSVQHTTTETVTKIPRALFQAHRINFTLSFSCFLAVSCLLVDLHDVVWLSKQAKLAFRKVYKSGGHLWV